MILAKRLKKGDGIGVFSPSSPATYFAKNRYKRAKHFIESNGFRVIEGSLTGKNDFYRSGTIKERVEELNDLILNDEVQCIMSSIGGMNSNSLLPYIDYMAIKNHPKIMIGYSDVTAILLGVYAKTGLITFYGPAAVASLGEFESMANETFSYFSDILIKKQNLPHILPTPQYWTDEFLDWEKQDREKIVHLNKLIKVHGGKAKGRLIGGNLNTMLGIWNTEYMPKIREGDILFIEDSLLNMEEIEREFSLLKISGVFEKISGIILGKHEGFDDRGSGRKHYEVLQEVMGEKDIPFISEFDCCHTHPMLTLPIGAEIILDADNLKVIINSNFII